MKYNAKRYKSLIDNVIYISLPATESSRHWEIQVRMVEGIPGMLSVYITDGYNYKRPGIYVEGFKELREAIRDLREWHSALGPMQQFESILANA